MNEDGDDIDPGEPVPEIVALRERPDDGFLARVRDGIYGRVAGSHVLDFAVNGILGFLQEMGNLIFGLLDRPDDRGPQEREGKTGE